MSPICTCFLIKYTLRPWCSSRYSNCTACLSTKQGYVYYYINFAFDHSFYQKTSKIGILKKILSSYINWNFERRCTKTQTLVSHLIAWRWVDIVLATGPLSCKRVPWIFQSDTKRMRQVRIELTTLGLWDLRAANCATAALYIPKFHSLIRFTRNQYACGWLPF